MKKTGYKTALLSHNSIIDEEMNELCSTFSNCETKEKFGVWKTPQDMKRRRRKTQTLKPPKGKYWWNDNNTAVAAGGILIVNGDEGFWALEEMCKKNSNTEYSDFGGKYHYDDCDIYATISREFREETYNTDEIPYSKVKELAMKGFVVKVIDDKYYCLVVDRKELDVKLSSDELKNAKNKTIASNNFNKFFYRSVGIEYILYSDLPKVQHKLAFRLVEVLKAIGKIKI